MRGPQKILLDWAEKASAMAVASLPLSPHYERFSIFVHFKEVALGLLMFLGIEPLRKGHGCQEELLLHELQSAQAQATQSDLILEFREQGLRPSSFPAVPMRTLVR
jgi:hypothetical protein